MSLLGTNKRKLCVLTIEDGMDVTEYVFDGVPRVSVENGWLSHVGQFNGEQAAVYMGRASHCWTRVVNSANVDPDLLKEGVLKRSRS